CGRPVACDGRWRGGGALTAGAAAGCVIAGDESSGAGFGGVIEASLRGVSRFGGVRICVGTTGCVAAGGDESSGAGAGFGGVVEASLRRVSRFGVSDLAASRFGGVRICAGATAGCVTAGGDGSCGAGAGFGGVAEASSCGV